MEPEARNETNGKPKQQEPDRSANHGHGNQHRPILVLVEREPAELLGQQQEADRAHQAEQQPDQAEPKTLEAQEETRAEPEKKARTRAPKAAGSKKTESAPSGAETEKPEGETDAKGGE